MWETYPNDENYQKREGMLKTYDSYQVIMITKS
jgi:hypothetical protein